MMHRDSLGTVQLIEPGAINWMTAGRGIVHSERKPEHLRTVRFRNHGLQLWTALPLAHEEDTVNGQRGPDDPVDVQSRGDAVCDDLVDLRAGRQRYGVLAHDVR